MTHYIIGKGILILISPLSVGQCRNEAYCLQISFEVYMEVSLSIDSREKLTEVRNTGLDKARRRNTRLYKYDGQQLVLVPRMSTHQVISIYTNV